MLRALNELFEAHIRGENIKQQFIDFHGKAWRLLSRRLQNIEERLDALT